MKIFKSPIFWILVSGFLLSLGLLFLLPHMGITSFLPRILWSLVPLFIAGLLTLILSIIRLKKALKSQDQSSSSANPFDTDLSIKTWHEPLRAETKNALDVLKQSGKSKVKMGQEPLDIFRFYLVFGNNASGKTSLLEHSGIHFPRRFPSSADLAKQTVHFTQWWFSNQGIFLESPTRYVTGEEGDDEFQFWLTQFEKEGKRKALDGVLLVVSLRELLNEGHGVQDLATRFRDKIALMMSTLRLELPIYLVFTHADLLPGFREFFENMQEPESHQIFGATFALRGNLSPARVRFEREYKKIWDSLQARVAGRLSQVSESNRRKQIFLFPNEFGAAQERIATFVEHLFKDTMRRERAMFRGFFLTSVLPADPSEMMSRAGQNSSNNPFADAEDGAHFLDHKSKLRGPGEAPKIESSQKPRSFFTFLLFGGVLKNDLSLSQVPGYRLGSLSRQALITAGLLSFFGLFFLIYGLTGFFKSKSYLGDVALTITEASRLKWKEPREFRTEYATLEKLLATIHGLESGAGGHTPPGYGHSSDALTLATETYILELNRMVGYDALRNLTATLEMGSKFYTPAEHAKLHDNLKLYLLLTTEGRSHFKDVKPQEFSALLNAAFSQEVIHKYGEENLPANMETGLEEHVNFYTDQFLAGKIPALEKGDPNLIATARQSLMGTPTIDGLYASIVGAEDASRDLSITEMGVPTDAALKSNAKIRGFYTKAAFDDDVMDRIAQGAEEPHQKDWVLGEGAVTTLPPEMQDQKQLYRALVDKYYQEYAEEWLQFLKSLSMHLPNEPSQASGKLSGYASTTQGLPAVLARILTEVNLIVPPSAAQGAVEKKMGRVGKLANMALESRDADKKVLRDRFKFLEELNGGAAGAGLMQDYFGSLRGLSEILSKLAQGGQAGTEISDAAQSLFNGKSDSPLNTAWSEATKIRNRYETQTWLPPLLETPVREVATYLTSAISTQLEAAYKSKVLTFYNQNLKGRYPIVKTGAQEANVEDLKAFFGPEKGTFALFMNSKLAPYINIVDDNVTSKHWNGIRINFNPAALEGISKAQAVSRRMYSDVGSQRIYNLNVSLMESRNTAKVSFRVGDDKISVKPGENQVRQTFRWPNENSYKGAEITVDNVNGGSEGRRVDGPWGFQKLLDGARALNLRNGGLTAKWRFNVAQKYDVDVTMEGNIPDRENPFTMPDYFKFDLPPNLINADDAANNATTPQ